MSVFTHMDVTTIDQAVSSLANKKAAIIAGGTEILGTVRTAVSPSVPETLINIKTIPGLDYIKEEGGFLKIGALTKLTDIYESSLVQGKYYALAEAAHKVATPELRNMGTIGGNICQGVQCWYYRSAFNFYPCLRKNPQGVCYALTGDNRYNSIFGAVNGCVAVNPSDTAAALVALNASIKTNKKTWEIKDFFAVNGEHTTALASDEIVTEIQVPTPAGGSKSAFFKFALRKSFDFAIVNCAALITSSGGSVTVARICLNAVHNLPRLATTAGDSLKGKAIDEASASAAADSALTGATALSENKYMILIAKSLVKRAVLACK